MSSTVRPTGSYRTFCYTVEQREVPIPRWKIEEDELVINLRLYSVIGSRYGIDDPVYDNRKLLSYKPFPVKRSRVERIRLARSVAKRLSLMNVPEDEQPGIAVQIFWSVKEAVPRVPIDVAMGSGTVVELVRPHSMELEAIIRQRPSCVICTELFDDNQQIIRLACSHHYHKRCFVRWLEVNDSCPLCRCPMPIEEYVEEPDDPVEPDELAVKPYTCDTLL